MKFRPLHDRVVIRRIEGEDKTKGGIIIPDTVKEKPQEGEVVAVGPGGRDESGKLTPVELKPGERVLFGKWSGTEVKIDGEELLIMKETDVMGVIEGATARALRMAKARSSDTNASMSNSGLMKNSISSRKIFSSGGKSSGLHRPLLDTASHTRRIAATRMRGARRFIPGSPPC